MGAERCNGWRLLLLLMLLRSKLDRAMRKEAVRHIRPTLVVSAWDHKPIEEENEKGGASRGPQFRRERTVPHELFASHYD